MEAVKRDAGWELETRWWAYADEGAAGFAGPREVVIRATNQLPPDVLRRGVTSGVMRRMERLLGEIVEQIAIRPEAESADRMFRATIAASAEKMPKSPRESPEEYYRQLLHLFEIVDAVSTEPVTELAEIMGVPKQTLKTRLRVARQRRADAESEGKS